MQGSINFDGSLIGNITGGGGGGGSEVVITPVLTSGTKIADVTVDGEDKDLFAPTPTPPTPATEVSVTQTLASGTKIGSIEVDGESTDLFAPTPTPPTPATEVSVTQVLTEGTKIASIEVDGDSTDIYSPNYSGDISSLQTGLSTANSNITALQRRMTTAEGNITTLQSDMTDAESIIGDGQLDIGNDLTDAVNEINQSLSDLENVIGQIDGVTIYKQILNQDIVSFSAESSMPIMKLVSNISNVSGCTEANIVVTGKNIFGGLELANAFVNAGGTIDTVNKTVSFTYGNSQVNILDKVKLKESTKYTFILTYSNSGNNNSLSLFYKTSEARYPINLNNSSDTKTTIIYTTTTAKIDKLVLSHYKASTTKIYYEESGLFEGVLTAADFENYNGNLYNIPFVDGGGNTLTVYNGSIDLINGVLIDNDNSTTYQLPATPINDLQGENSIWSNTGSIANVGYLDILNIS